MKLVIFGATGTVGRHLVDQALALEHDVRAFARNPDNLEINHPNLSLIAGDVLDQTSVNAAVFGADAVLITLGSPKLTGKLRSTGTRNIVQAMEKHGVKRLICQTTLGAGDSYANLDFFWKYLMFGMLLRFVMNDHNVQETIVRKSSLDWIIARPAAFKDGPASGTYKHGFPSNNREISLTISRADVADFMLKQLTNDHYLKQAAGISY